MIKKFFSLLLTLCMVLAMMPAMSVRAEETHTHCVCGATSCSGSEHNNLQTWQAWNETASLPSSGGYYYLTGDVTIASTWSPADGTVLCLNGHTITGKGTSIISVGGGTFTLTNCKNEGSVKHAEGESGKGVENKGTFNMYGGEITNNKADSSGSSGGGVENARTFNMYGGEITNNKADSSGSFDSSGGGVRNGYSATFNMYGGTIANNTAKNYGGGVENAGTFNMYGGEISNNKAGYHGGGVDNEGTFTMQGGQITTNETVQYGGGGVRNGYSATFTMQGGEITNNQATTIGGGVSYLGGFFNVSGNVKITGNKNQSNASSNLYLGSNQTITIESPLTVGALIGVTVKDSPTEGNPVVITSAGSSDHSSFFFSDSSNYQVYNDNNTVKLRVQSGSPAGHTHCICGATHSSVGNHIAQENTTFTAWESNNSLPLSSGCYYLTQDVTVDGQWQPADGTVLCLNGHTISGASGSYSETIEVESGVHFTLTDCANSDTQGKIVPSGGCSAVFISNGGSFTMYGGNISGGTVDYEGMVYVSGSFTMNGGNISNNQSNTSNTGDKIFCGVHVWSDGTFTMNNGNISGNTFESKGAGVHNNGTFTMNGGNITQNVAQSNKGGGVYNTGTFTMNGGSITGNSASQGGGVYNDSQGTFKVSGTPIIKDNKQDETNNNNLYLCSGKTINIEGSLSAGTLIGVTVENSPTTQGTSVDITSTVSSDYSSFFKSDNTSYQIEFDNNKLIMNVQTCSHSGLGVTGQAATCTTNGWNDYYQCSKCSGYFTNSECTTPIPNLELWKTGDGKIPALGHDWIYSANGATLTASCRRKASCGMGDQTLTLTIDDSLTYTGSELTLASFGESTSGWTTNVNSTLPTITYYNTETKDATTGGIAVSGNPKDVGYYYASATVGTDGNSATAVKTFEIKKAESEFSTTPVGATTLTYNTNAQNLLTTEAATSHGTIQYAVTATESQPEDSAFSASTPTATAAGTYYVYYKVAGDANHKDKICATPVTVTIDKASQSVSAPTASETKATKVTLNEVAGQGPTTYAKNTTNEAPTDPSAWQTSNVFTALTKNTTYYFFAKCAGDNNYNAGTSTGAEIATPDLTSRTISGVTAKDGVNTTGISYGTAITPGTLFTGTPVLENAENPVTAYKYEGVSSTGYPENTAAPTAVGTYKLVIVMNDDNYYGTQEIPFTIVKSSPAAVNATGVAPTGSNVSDGKIQVTGVDTSLYTLEYKGTGETASPANWTAIEGTEVANLAAGGTYLVRIKGTDNNNESPTTEVTIPAYVAPPAGGGGIGGGGGASTPSTDKNNDSKTETTTLPDGTKVETSTTTDETTGATTVEEKKTALDGTVTETKTTTQKDGSSETTSTETRTDGSTTETNTTVDTEGTAQSVVRDKDFPTGDVLTIRKTEEPSGEVSYVLATLVTEEATIVKAKVERAEALANMKNIPYRVKVLDENGKLDYKVRVNTGDVKANQTLYVYKYDSKTKSFGLVQADYQKVNADEKANIICDFEKLISTQRYQLVTKSKAGLLDKKILATVKVKIGQKSLKVNQSTSFKLDEKLNLENVSTIKYSTSDKQVVKVSKAGKITGKNTGTADIKATITLINGKTKTVRMKIKVK